MTRLRQSLLMFRGFRRSDAGTVIPLIGLMALVLVGCIGIAIDIGRAVVVRARLVDSLDSAGLAVASRTSAVDINAEAAKFVAANFVANFAGATVSDVVATQSADNSVVTVSATATMPTSFMQLFGNDTVTVNATSEVTRAVAGLELALVLDNTTSMSSSMGDLKDAANELIDQLYRGSIVTKNVFVGLVPFSQAVNIGPSRTAWIDTDYSDDLDWGTTSWGGCVEARLDGRDLTDEPPSAAASLFKAYYWESGEHNDWIESDDDKGKGKGKGKGKKKDVTYTINSQQGPNRGCPNEVTPLTPDRAKVEAGISAMKAIGNTHINLGAVWGWRMLSPRWRGYWDGDMAANNLPLDYATRRMTKAAVIMTDGENTMSDRIYTAYGDLSERRLGTRDPGTATTKLNEKLTDVCDGMKSQGIVVYTVAFRNPDATTKAVMQSCATNTSYAFDAANKAALIDSFQRIGDSLSNLRVSR